MTLIETETDFLQLLKTAATSDPLDVMCAVHELLNKPKPGSLVAPFIGQLLAAFDSGVDRALASGALQSRTLTDEALQQATDLKELHLPVLKVNVPIGKAYKKLAAHREALEQAASAPVEKTVFVKAAAGKIKPTANNRHLKHSKPAKAKRPPIGYNAPPRPNFKHWAIKTRLPML